MTRGDIVVVAGGGYARKPRPAIIIQSDIFPETNSVTMCLVTSDTDPAPMLRPRIMPDSQNNLERPSWIMIDKILTLPRAQINRRIGRLADSDQNNLNRALTVFLGLAGG